MLLTVRAPTDGHRCVVWSGDAVQAGLDPAHDAGHSERSIMKQTGHTSREMVDRYIRDGDLFRDNAAARVQL